MKRSTVLTLPLSYYTLVQDYVWGRGKDYVRGWGKGTMLGEVDGVKLDEGIMRIVICKLSWL